MTDPGFVLPLRARICLPGNNIGPIISTSAGKHRFRLETWRAIDASHEICGNVAKLCAEELNGFVVV